MIETRIAKFGNSQAVRIPKPVLQRAGIVDAVTIEERDGGLFIRRKEPPPDPRAGWAESIAAMVANGDANLVWPDDFDDGVKLGPW